MFIRFACYLAQPKILTEGSGTGKEMSLPKNISEIAALSGMPAEHAARTVSTIWIMI